MVERCRGALVGRDRARTRAAWERFVAGGSDPGEVPWSIATSWIRCRDVHELAPQDAHPLPVEQPAPCAGLPDAAVFAELGGIASALAERYHGCVTAVSDATGCILATWGRGRVRRHADEVGCCPSHRWDEPRAGTNGLGTALVRARVSSVDGPEHWSPRLHEWSSVAVAYADPSSPIGALCVTSWKDPVPLGPVDLLVGCRSVPRLLSRMARAREEHLLAVFDREAGRRTPVVALDTSGRLVAANAAARRRGVTAHPGQYALEEDTVPRCSPVGFVRSVCTPAAHEDGWQGSAVLRPPGGAEAAAYQVVPVAVGGRPAGVVLRADPGAARDGEPLGPTPDVPLVRGHGATHVPAVTDRGRMVRVPVADIRFAHSEGHAVWLTTDHGRVRAARRGIDRVEQDLSGAGFLRVHRSYLVNLARVREITPRGDRLTLATTTSGDQRIPVSRRAAPLVRRALGLQSHPPPRQPSTRPRKSIARG